MMSLLLAMLLVGCTAPRALPHGANASDCASCHPEQYDEWSESAHATSGASPVFVAMLPEIERAWGTSARRECEHCHAPGHGGDDGIGCVSCHAAIGNERESDGRLLVDLEAPLAGPTAALGDAHPTRPGAFLASPSLCGTCHEVTGPGLFAEPTLSEYRASGLESIGTTCATCHLPEVGAGRRSHRFVGFDPPWLAPLSARAAAAERTRALLARALTVFVEMSGDRARVTVENAGAGHSVPTGISFLRDVWVDVTLTLADGRTSTRSRVLELGDVPRRDGERVALPTAADVIDRRRLGFAETMSVTLTVPPATARVDAHLRARAIRANALDALDLGHLDVPTHEVATATAER